MHTRMPLAATATANKSGSLASTSVSVQQGGLVSSPFESSPATAVTVVTAKQRNGAPSPSKAEVEATVHNAAAAAATDQHANSNNGKSAAGLHHNL